MELKNSSKSGDLSPLDSSSDTEEKEVSDEDDDDRNHKHRKRDTRSQSLERDTLETVFTRAYRKRYKPFENGRSFRGNEFQDGGTGKNYNIAALDKDFTSKFDKRRSGMAPISRGNVDLNQRIRPNQSFPGEPSHGRGRGRDSGSWSQRDRFSSVDFASQMAQHGSITPGLFPGRGLPNTQNASWNGFGLIPTITNGGLEALHSIGLQGTLRPAVNNNMGIPRPRCRDFEERGFCLRGDMCPMEHGVNCIVVEDVQSLSQFNLPVSLSSAPLVGPTVGPGVLPVGAPSSTLMNNKSVGRSSKPDAVADDVMFSGALSGSAIVGGADSYDPDEPLWDHNDPKTSNAHLALHPFKDNETGSFTGADTSEHHNSRLRDGVDNESALRSARFPVKNMEDQDALGHIQGSSGQGKRIIPDDTIPSIMDSSANAQSNTSRFTRKPSQKAQRTLFVCGIPEKSNSKDALLSHFQKFGTVVDIFIPSNQERAFVQFSKREEAEAALRAPDAVMGNRFIKLWWANHDTVPGNGIKNNNIEHSTHYGLTASSVPSQLIYVNKGKVNIPAAVSEASATNGSNPQTLQKKLELEQLKKELRKKQELLAQKQNEFRLQLDKLQKHATGKGEVLSEPFAKKPRVRTASDAAKITTPRPSNPATNMQSHHSETPVDKNKSSENVTSSSPKTKALALKQESSGLKQQNRSFTAAGTPFLVNRYKLDNRPTEFKIMPPLPLSLANVEALKEHFSSHGDLSNVKLEEIEATDDSSEREAPKIFSAYVTFTTRHSAERAFANGKCWQGHKLQFVWAASGTENTQSASKLLVDTDPSPAENLHQKESNENPESKFDVEHADELLEASEPSPTSLPGENNSHEFGGPVEKEYGPTAVSEEKESSADNAC